MRKYHQQQILELLKTLNEAHAELERLFKLKQWDAAVGLLADCQESAVQVGGFIETIEGEGTKTVTLLEKYCDLVFEIAQNIEAHTILDTQNSGRANAYSPLREKLLDIEHSVKTDLKPNKIEIVFLPYKVSMWDSFESIWLAAKDDPACDAFVVPIPYYDRLPGGAFGDMHYEGGDYPDYVPVVDWKEYNLEARRPDVAYIHNPYDGNNYVSSVHSNYYSRELKKHVDKLIYIPYYASDHVPALSFAASAAALSVDAIVASSAEDADAYRRAGSKCEILPLGSPKIDRIINLEKHRLRIPEKWSKLKGKKIFFLNTSVGSLLRRNEAYFQKLRALFSLFEGRDDLALLWRPHPLTDATIGSMRPQFRVMFDELAQVVNNGSFGVMDDTPDMGVSIAISDAYIGDGASSLVYLYALTGKPVFLINFKMPLTPTDAELEELTKTDVLLAPCRAENSRFAGYAFCYSVNALCGIDFDSGSAVRVSSVPGEKNRVGLYGQPVNIGEKLLLPPVMAKRWAEYNTSTGEWKTYDIPAEAEPKIKNGRYFATALDTEDIAVFMPAHSRCFVKYNKKTGEFKYYSDWYKEFARCVVDINLGCFIGFSELIGDSVFFTSAQGNIVLELKVSSMKTKIHQVGGANRRYFNITYDGCDFWLSTYMLPGTNERQNVVVRWSRATGKVREYPLQPVSYDKLNEISDFASIHYFNGKVLVFPYGVNEIFLIDPATDDIKMLDTGLDYKLGDRKNPYYAIADGAACVKYFERDKKTLLIWSYYDNSLLSVTADFSISKKKLTVDGIGALLKSTDIIPPYVYNESAYLTPQDYIESVLVGKIPAFDLERAEYSGNVVVNTDGTCGEKIHGYVTKHLSM